MNQSVLSPVESSDNENQSPTAWIVPGPREIKNLLTLPTSPKMDYHQPSNIFKGIVPEEESHCCEDSVSAKIHFC